MVFQLPIRDPKKANRASHHLWQDGTSLRTQGESIKHAPNCGYHFVSPSPHFSLSAIGPFPVPENPPFCGSPTSFCRIHCFPSLGSWGAKGDSKWWSSIRCMFDSLWRTSSLHSFVVAEPPSRHTALLEVLHAPPLPFCWITLSSDFPLLPEHVQVDWTQHLRFRSTALVPQKGLRTQPQIGVNFLWLKYSKAFGCKFLVTKFSRKCLRKFCTNFHTKFRSNFHARTTLQPISRFATRLQNPALNLILAALCSVSDWAALGVISEHSCIDEYGSAFSY